MKYLIILLASTLTGCAAMDWVVNNEDIITTGADTVDGFGPYGAILGLGATSLLGFAKWYTHKASAREIIISTQAAKDNLPPNAKEKLKEGYNEFMPEKVKNYVAKVKKGLS